MKYFRRYRPNSPVAFFIDEEGNEVSESVAMTNLQETSAKGKTHHANESYKPKSQEKLLQEKDDEIRRLRALTGQAHEPIEEPTHENVKESALAAGYSEMESDIFANPERYRGRVERD